MKISFITLFPEYYSSFKSHSIIKNSISKGIVEIEEINIRDFSKDNYVDDYVFGGGPGMLMLIEPVVRALESIRTEDSYVIMTSPKGRVYNQDKAKEFANKIKHLIIICGHYEGIDSRILNFIDEEISIGQFITTGGEGISTIIADSVIRLLPEAIKEESHIQDSFDDVLVEHDQFTKPREFRGLKVPKVLLSGNHQEIERWKKESSYKNTIEFYKKNKK